MSSRSKCGKHSKALPAILDEDRISNLPSCLIVKIISLLPTKDAVATSALCPRWKKLWTFVTSLKFDDQLKAPTPSAMGFERFVNRVLLLRDKSSCLQSFHIKCDGQYDGSVVNTWIASVIWCNIQVLDLSIPINNPVFFPSNLFLCKTLVVLKLVARGKANIPSSFYLAVLKTLHLDKVELSDDVSVARLLSGCPVLEELRLGRCIGKNVSMINIIASALTSLTIEFLPYDDNAQIIDYEYQVSIDTPFLKYFCFSDFDPQSYVIKNLNHLIQAEIVPVDGEFIRNPDDILNAISQVQNLVLSYDFMEVLCFNVPGLELPMFSNLTCIKLHNVNNSWTRVLKLLESTPHLETLHFQEHSFNIRGDGPSDALPPSCLLTHLNIMKVDVPCEHDYYEIDMVEYFLKNAKVLEKLTIDYQAMGYHAEEDFRYLHRLLICPRSSSKCKVEVLQLLQCTSFYTM